MIFSKFHKLKLLGRKSAVKDFLHQMVKYGEKRTFDFKPKSPIGSAIYAVIILYTFNQQMFNAQQFNATTMNNSYDPIL
jgi:hypothetical protein